MLPGTGDCVNITRIGVPPYTRGRVVPQYTLKTPCGCFASVGTNYDTSMLRKANTNATSMM